MTGQWEENEKACLIPTTEKTKTKEINTAGLVQYTFSLANVGSSDKWVRYDGEL